jgi:NTE family protein
MKNNQPPTQKKKINLALQGGGAHGAYTWGVLDRLLEDERIEIEGVSGTSAGALNSAIMVSSLLSSHSREKARLTMREFWMELSTYGSFNAFSHSPFNMNDSKKWNLDWNPLYIINNLLSRLFSPYVTNPLNYNMLEGLLKKYVNIDAIKNSKDIKLFIAATNVRTGHATIFQNHEMTYDAILASGCLPYIFQAIKIKDDYYWDGGYTGNPCLWPMSYNCSCNDIVIVEINPLRRKEHPVMGTEILNRINEIAFNSNLISEIRAIHFVNRLIDDNKILADKYHKTNLHLIAASHEMASLNASSKMNISRDFFEYLFKLGRDTADAWIKENFESIGKTSSVDIVEVFLSNSRMPVKPKNAE